MIALWLKIPIIKNVKKGEYMHSLVITILSIVLVVILMLALIFYGFGASSRALNETAATQLSASMKQISGALLLYEHDNGDWPTSLGDLVSGNYLVALPIPSKDAYDSSVGNSSAVDWQIKPTRYIELTSKINATSCKAINKRSDIVVGGAIVDGNGDGIPDSDTALPSTEYCFGSAAPFTYRFFAPGGVVAAASSGSGSSGGSSGSGSGSGSGGPTVHSLAGYSGKAGNTWISNTYYILNTGPDSGATMYDFGYVPGMADSNPLGNWIFLNGATNLYSVDFLFESESSVSSFSVTVNGVDKTAYFSAYSQTTLSGLGYPSCASIPFASGTVSPTCVLITSVMADGGGGTTPRSILSAGANTVVVNINGNEHQYTITAVDIANSMDAVSSGLGKTALNAYKPQGLINRVKAMGATPVALVSQSGGTAVSFSTGSPIVNFGSSVGVSNPAELVTLKDINASEYVDIPLNVLCSTHSITINGFSCTFNSLVTLQPYRRNGAYNLNTTKQLWVNIPGMTSAYQASLPLIIQYQ